MSPWNASDLHVRAAFPVPDVSDPLPCSSAVALHLLREMLATEEWASPGAQTITFRSWPTSEYTPNFVSLAFAMVDSRFSSRC